MMDRINSEMGAPADWGQFGDVQGMKYDPSQIRQAAEDAAYKRQTNRLDPRFDKEREALDIRLRNQGLGYGDSAYDSAMGTFNTGKNDAYEQARLSSSEQGMGEAGQLWNQQVQGTDMANVLRDKQIQEYLAKRGFSLGEQNALNQGQTLADLQQTTGGSE
jgi:hypothetical protein